MLPLLRRRRDALLCAGGKVKPDFAAQVEALDTSRTGDTPTHSATQSRPLLTTHPRFRVVQRAQEARCYIFPACSQRSCSFVCRLLKQHGADLSLRDMEALATQVGVLLLPLLRCCVVLCRCLNCFSVSSRCMPLCFAPSPSHSHPTSTPNPNQNSVTPPNRPVPPDPRQA